MHIYKSVYVQSTVNGSNEFLESYVCVKHKVNISSITHSRIIKYREIPVLPSYCILTCYLWQARQVQAQAHSFFWGMDPSRWQGRMIPDLPAGCVLCVQPWELCPGLLLCRRVYPAAASSFSVCCYLYLRLYKVLALASQAELITWLNAMPRLPHCLSCSRPWEIRGCPTEHRNLSISQEEFPRHQLCPTGMGRSKTSWL